MEDGGWRGPWRAVGGFVWQFGWRWRGGGALWRGLGRLARRGGAEWRRGNRDDASDRGCGLCLVKAEWNVTATGPPWLSYLLYA